MKLQICSLFF